MRSQLQQPADDERIVKDLKVFAKEYEVPFAQGKTAVGESSGKERDIRQDGQIRTPSYHFL